VELNLQLGLFHEWFQPCGKIYLHEGLVLAAASEALSQARKQIVDVHDAVLRYVGALRHTLLSGWGCASRDTELAERGQVSHLEDTLFLD
jgi:hypothetical protein